MKRKDFLKFTSVTGLGVVSGLPLVNLISSPKEIVVKVDSEEYFWSLLSRFLFSVGAGIVSSSIYDYYKNSDNVLKNGINYANQLMLDNGGFNDYSRSQVYHHKDKFGTTAAYQAINSEGNVCAPFFNFKRQKNVPVTMLEGPDLTTLATISDKSSKNFQSKKAAADWLLPIKGITQGIGSFEEGYKRPTTYVSRGGIVSIDYKSNKRGRGLASIGISQGTKKVLEEEVLIDYKG